jgi:methyl acetate hydrolase
MPIRRHHRYVGDGTESCDRVRVLNRLRSDADRVIQAGLDAVLESAVTRGVLRGVAAAAWCDAGLEYSGAAGDSGSGAMQPDTVVWVASMTKVVTASAVMQLVEKGLLDLDQPAGDFIPYLRDVQVLTGFGQDGAAILRSPVRPVTTRQLLAHTSGFGYDWADESLNRFVPTLTEAAPGSQAGYEHPLVFDPGDGWSYGIGTDWAGRVVEAVSGQRLDAYFSDHLLGPLQMNDTSFSASGFEPGRVATMHARDRGGLAPVAFGLPVSPEMLMAGGGLYSTAVDFLRFCRMLLAGGTLDGVRALTPESVTLMATNHVGQLDVAGWSSYNTGLTNDVRLATVGMPKWGLGMLIDEGGTPNGRKPGSVGWGGLANTYFWIDFQAAATGVFITQVLPFFDAESLDVYAAFERAVYATNV